MNHKKREQAARVRKHARRAKTWEMWCAYTRPRLVRQLDREAVDRLRDFATAEPDALAALALEQLP